MPLSRRARWRSAAKFLRSQRQRILAVQTSANPRALATSPAARTMEEPMTRDAVTMPFREPARGAINLVSQVIERCNLNLRLQLPLTCDAQQAVQTLWECLRADA